MRVLIVSHEHPPLPGGAGVGVCHLARALVAAGHPTSVVTAGPTAGVEERDGVRVRRLPCGERAGLRLWLTFLARAPAAVRSELARFAPAVVASFVPVVAGHAVARSGCAVPHVTSFVGADIHDPTRPIGADRNPLVRRLTRVALRHAAAVTAGSDDMVRRIETVFPDRRVEKISLGVPLLHAPESARHELGLRPESLVVATACRLVRRKRLDLLLEAVAALRETRLEVVVAGDGPLGPALRRRAERLGIADRVRFAGWVDEQEKATILAAADVFCLPSEHEAFGLAMVEAMGLGGAVVASEGGGQNEIVRDGVEGLLVPVGDSAALAAALATLANDRPRLEAMQRAATERARRFTPEATAAGFLTLFRRLVAS